VELFEFQKPIYAPASSCHNDRVTIQTLIDAHCHVQDGALASFLDDVLARARRAGVVGIISNGTEPADWQRLSDLAAADAAIWPCYGVHPWGVGRCEAGWFERLEEMMRHGPADRPPAVGEIGLDRYVTPRDEALQEAVFRRQLALARRLDRPAMLHVVRAWPWLTKGLEDCPPPAKFLLHAFTGPVEVVAPLAKLGAYFSVGPAAVAPGRERAWRALRVVPRDRLVIETDAPDFHPRGLEPRLRDETGKPLNEPANLPHVLTGLATALDIPSAELAEMTTDNAKRLWE